MNMVQPQKRIYRNDVSQQTREKQSIAHQGRKHSNDRYLWQEQLIGL